MNPRGYQVPVSVVLALAEGRGGADADRLLVSAQRSRQALLLRAVAVQAAESGHPHAAVAEAGYRLLVDAERADPKAAATLLRYPAVGAWAIEALAALRGAAPQSARVDRLMTVAAAAAIRAGAGFEVEVPIEAADAALALPSLGRFILPRPAGDHVAQLRHGAGVVELTGPQATMRLAGPPGVDTPTWLAVRTLSARGRETVSVSFDDVDDYRFPSDAAGIDLADRVGAVEFSRWDRIFAAAWRILSDRHPVTAREVAALVTAVSPIADPPAGQRNASSRAASGAVAATRPRDPLSFALALAHEVQHVKLGVLMDLIRLTKAPATEVYYAPWRPDPRPLHALLQGAYAHAGVAEFWLRESAALPAGGARLAALSEFSRWRDASAQVAEFLAGHPGLTEHGRLFADGLSRRLRARERVRVPKAALELSHELAKTHRATWESENSGGSATSQIFR